MPLPILLATALGCAGTAEAPEEPAPTEAPVEAPPEAPAPAAEPGQKVDLNTATADELRAIPGVGDRMVHEFEEYRPYVSIQQFRREIGKYVDAQTVAGYEEHVYVPVDPDASDAATLQQLPGIDAAEAEALVAGRPYASRDAFLQALADKATPEEIARGQAMLATP
ncbi:MAG: helix-hairpin-helix domain-containing protein [Myxococcota bacterium]